MVQKKLNILFSVGNLIPPTGGAERSLFALSERFSKDFNVTILTPSKNNLEKKQNGYTLKAIKIPKKVTRLKSFLKINAQNKWWGGILNEYLKEYPQHFVASHGILLPSINKVTQPTKKIVFVRGLSSIMPNVYVDPIKEKGRLFKHLSPIFKIQYPLLKTFQKECIKAQKEADYLIVNSTFLQGVVEEYIGRKPSIIYSEVKKTDFKITRLKGEKILCITPGYSKGIDIVVKIAKKMPKKQFLIIGKKDPTAKKYYKQITKLPNIKFIGHIEDMRKVYKQTKLLLVPSRVYEGFGRATIDAMTNGIPSIISNRGGTPEALGNAGDVVKTLEDIKEWAYQIKKYDSKKYYAKKSKQALKRMKNLEESLKKQYGFVIRQLKKAYTI